jgi:hypothetical protein
MHRIYYDNHSTVEAAADLASPWAPWATGIIGALSTLWVDLRRRRYKEAARTVVAGVFDAKLLADKLADEDGKIDKMEFLEKLAVMLGDRQGKMGNRELIREIADYVEKRYL